MPVEDGFQSLETLAAKVDIRRCLSMELKRWSRLVRNKVLRFEEFTPRKVTYSEDKNEVKTEFCSSLKCQILLFEFLAEESVDDRLPLLPISRNI
ncbi:hypothetical protein CDAR_401081 [Caerostris darwini]|uniref:Uncharacterized protein n=1 Tax=Caerostris darwini TaxID=1538125 RepID=A0AAV4TIH7_9ARAC|nr:hypothetical protein CDAR_401081 [Caerostris darwini]